VGASAGGVRALQILAAQLPADFPAPVLAVQHVGSHPSVLPSLLTRAGPLPAIHATDGEPIQPGKILVAPPDYHMVVHDGTVRLARGPKENHARPAIDPLFRSAALTFGQGVIGVVLTGRLDDGTAGLQAIKRSGGTAVVQDPTEAEAPSMPLSAQRYVKVDHSVGLLGMGGLLASLAAKPVPSAAAASAKSDKHEHAIALGKGPFMEHLEAIGKPSTYSCPDCQGTLWEIYDTQPQRFRCHTGHAYTLRSLQHTQAGTTDEALWSALRALQEKEMLLKDVAESHHAARERGDALRVEAEAGEAGRHGDELRRLIQSLPPPPE